MPNMLTEVEPYEVSLVAKAANKRKFLLFKNADTGNETGETKENKSSSPEQHSDTTQDTDLTKNDPSKAQEGDETLAQTKVETAELTKADIENLPDTVKGLVMALWKERADVAEKAQRLEKELAERIEKEETARFTEIAKSLDKIPGKTDDLAMALRTLHKADQSAYEIIENALKGANQAIAESKLFDELGSDSANTNAGSAWAKIETMANSLVQKDGSLSRGTAISKILADHPELYSQYLEEEEGR